MNDFSYTDIVPGCLELKPVPGVFLRFAAEREELALPYAELRRIETDLDKTRIEFSYLAYRVTVQGRNLEIVYQAAAEAYARLIGAKSFLEGNQAPRSAWVREIRIEPLESDERRKR